jgi:hypothetical protein
MTRTNSSRSSRVVLVLVLVAALAAPAAAVSVADTDVPEEAAVGSQITATVSLDRLYRSPELERWELRGQTELTDVSWVVVYVDQTGATRDRQQFTGQSFSGATVAAADGTSEVTVRVTGTVPGIDEFSYDPPQSYELVTLTRAQQGGASAAIDSWTSHHYTRTSDGARESLDAAAAAIERADAAGANTNTARESFESAVDAYESGNFDNARRLADRATTEADSARSSARTRSRLLLAGAGLLVVGAVVGGVLYWRSQQGPGDPLG